MRPGSAMTAAARLAASRSMVAGEWFRYTPLPVETDYGTNVQPVKAEALTAKMRAMDADEVPSDMRVEGARHLRLVCIPLAGVEWSRTDMVGNSDGSRIYQVRGVLDVPGQDPLLTGLLLTDGGA
jgi:hypothetical protein